MVTSILKGMHLTPSKHGPFLYTKILADPYAPIKSTPSGSDPSNPSSTSLPSNSTDRATIIIGLYVDNLVLYSTSQAEEDLIQELFQAKLKVDFMGDVDYFLGFAFTWACQYDVHLSIYLCQSAFTKLTSQHFGTNKFNRTPNMTPYCSRYPIDAIPNADPKDPDLKRHAKVYQSIVSYTN